VIIHSQAYEKHYKVWTIKLDLSVDLASLISHTKVCSCMISSNIFTNTIVLEQRVDLSK